MIIFANLLVVIAQIVDYVLWAYAWILLARVVISWIKYWLCRGIDETNNRVTVVSIDP